MLAPTHIFFSSHGLTVLCALSSFIAVYKSALVSQKMLFWLLLGALVAYLYFSMYSKTRHLPPGPVPLPLIGNLHQLILGTIKHKGVVAVLREWKKKYGDVHTFWLGPVPTVNICDYQLAHDAMIKKGSNFADRFYLYLFDIVRDGKGVIFSSGSTWTEQRRFSLHTLRNFGLGRNVMEDRIMLEYDYRSNLLNKEIEKAGGKLDTDPYHWIELSVGNVINRLLFTERFLEDEEKEFFRLKENLDRLIGQGSMLDLLLSKRNSEWPILKQHKEKKLKPLWEIVHFIRSQVEKRKADIASGEHEIRDNGEDFVDAFLLEMQKSDHAESFTEGDLVTTVLDLWLAGQETTTTTLQWAFGLLVRNPDVIQKIQEELDRVTGQNRSLKLSDKAETPYLNAVILEVLRVSMLVPMNMWRKAHEDVVVGQFHIPKGTAITAQLSVIMSDQDTFEDALKFNPSRFIENNHLEQYVVPFGMGKRACLGESLARAELYLILGNFVLDYDIAPNLQHYPDIQAANELGAVRKSKPYRLLLSKRI